MSEEPCRICGGEVRVDSERGPKRIGATEGELRDVRVCTNPSCRMNTGPRKIGDRV